MDGGFGLVVLIWSLLRWMRYMEWVSCFYGCLGPFFRPSIILFNLRVFDNKANINNVIFIASLLH